MDRIRINYIVDLLMSISFLFTSITGIVLLRFFPSGTRQGSYQTLLGIIKGDWVFVHDISGILLTILVVLHFVLHWDWIVGITKSILKKK